MRGLYLSHFFQPLNYSVAKITVLIPRAACYGCVRPEQTHWTISSSIYALSPRNRDRAVWEMAAWELHQAITFLSDGPLDSLCHFGSLNGDVFVSPIIRHPSKRSPGSVHVSADLSLDRIYLEYGGHPHLRRRRDRPSAESHHLVLQPAPAGGGVGRSLHPRSAGVLCAATVESGTV